MLIFTLKNERQSRVVRHEDGPIEFGRGPERELPRVIIEDRYTSRDQLRAEETPTGDVRITSLGSTPITLADGTQINQGESRTMMAPAQISFGYTTLLIGVIPKETDQFTSSLHTISPPSRTRSQNVASIKRPAQADAPTPEMLTEWFERLLHVQKAAAGSDEFYQQTAQAVVEIIGL